MNNSWRIRYYKESDETKILKLRKAVFGDIDPIRSDLSTWNWQFKDNPAGEFFCLLAENKNSEIVGQYSVIPARFNLYGKESMFAFSCDTMTHPDYRREGMFITLSRELYKNLEMQNINTIWGFPNERSVRGFTKHLDWKLIDVYPLRVIPLSIFSIFKSFILKKPNKRKNRLFLGPKSIEMFNAIIEPVNFFDGEFDELWIKNKNILPVIQVRDSNYLNWRYIKNKAFDYRPFIVRQKSNTAGYFVIRLVDLMGHYFGVLVDLFPFPIIDYKITKQIIRFAGDYCKIHGASFLTCLLPFADAKFLRKAGLYRVPENLNPKKWYFGYKHNGGNNKYLNLSSNWYITYGDTDIV